MTQNAQESEQISEDTVIILDDDNVVSDRPQGQARDINNKIDMLDDSLARLNNELDSIRDSVDEGLEKLGDNDLDLTSKVSDTYKRLGELDKTYKSLSEISADIHQEIGKLTNDISRVATQSSAELEKLEATSEVHNSYMVQKNEALAQRVDRLVTEANETSTKLQLSIKDVQHTILTSEQKLIVDIDNLAEDTQGRDEVLAREIDSANTGIENNAARIIKLNKVDEALDKRAHDLEKTTTELDDDLKQLDASVIFLTAESESLTDSVERIVEHTARLQKESDDHATKIGSIQSRISKMAADLVDLGDNQTLHMRGALGLLLLVAIAVTGVYLYQDSSSALLVERVQERATLVNDNIVDLDDKIVNTNDALNDQLVVLNEDLSEKIIMLEDKVVDVDRKLQHLDDQASSINGRLSVDSPMDNFGGDNTVHGSQWLREQPAANYMIQLATVKQPAQMYELVQSYSSYLKQPVAYYVNANGDSVMLYGQFDNEAAAAAAIRRLPHRIGYQYPSVRSVANIQQQI